jgi:hypothetical protein
MSSVHLISSHPHPSHQPATVGAVPSRPDVPLQSQEVEAADQEWPQMWQYEHRFSHSSPRSDEQQGTIYTV